MSDSMNFSDYEDYVESEIAPNALEWASLPIFSLLLLVGLVGNGLVVFAVIRNPVMRTVTNIFLVNLALADFLVLLFCLPPTVLTDVTKTWWFGSNVCKITIYLQNLSITVSVLTLVSISVERYYAICKPLKFKNTVGRTKWGLVSVWLLAMVLSTPDALTVEAQRYSWKNPNFTSVLLTRCQDTWGAEVQNVYQMTQTGVLFLFPLAVIGVLYGNVAYHLWLKSAPPSDRDRLNARQLTRLMSSKFPKNSQGEFEQSQLAAADKARFREIVIRRKAAKMLIAVVALFIICYLPVHVYNILRALAVLPQLSGLAAAAMKFSIRFLTYFNSCINPIIYNFMCGGRLEKFQREFRRACGCFHLRLTLRRFTTPDLTTRGGTRLTSLGGTRLTSPAGMRLTSRGETRPINVRFGPDPRRSDPTPLSSRPKASVPDRKATLNPTIPELPTSTMVSDEQSVQMVATQMVATPSIWTKFPDDIDLCDPIEV